jgi:hypothetical protein
VEILESLPILVVDLVSDNEDEVALPGKVVPMDLSEDTEGEAKSLWEFDDLHLS